MLSAMLCGYWRRDFVVKRKCSDKYAKERGGNRHRHLEKGPQRAAGTGRRVKRSSM